MEGADRFWARLGPAERGAIERIATRRTFATGEFLCRQGESASNVVIVLSGHVKVVTSGTGETDGREVVVAVRSTGDVIGEMAAMENGVRSATVEALDTVEVLTMPGPRFVTLCQKEPKLSWTLSVVLAGRLRDVGSKWVDYGGGGTTMSRVVALLLEMAVQHGRHTVHGIEIDTPATQQELASTAATSRESWGRVLRELRSKGLISTGRRKVTIHRLAELQRLAR
ncbi:Crp/Fnr family transcriptional regulator [Amycolatopsis sp. cg5]|uniref:Crp/Fnr family transcriptional regulator n=1 Tax=Amycolatopsis sp. cg5 TaxID=3238802 RepID=UPI003524D24E